MLTRYFFRQQNEHEKKQKKKIGRKILIFTVEWHSIETENYCWAADTENEFEKWFHDIFFCGSLNGCHWRQMCFDMVLIMVGNKSLLNGLKRGFIHQFCDDIWIRKPIKLLKLNKAYQSLTSVSKSQSSTKFSKPVKFSMHKQAFNA